MVTLTLLNLEKLLVNILMEKMFMKNFVLLIMQEINITNVKKLIKNIGDN